MPTSTCRRSSAASSATGRDVDIKGSSLRELSGGAGKAKMKIGESARLRSGCDIDKMLSCTCSEAEEVDIK